MLQLFDFLLLSKRFRLNPKLCTVSGGAVEDGAYFGTLYAMADENYKEPRKCESYDSKDVGFSIAETKQERVI